MTLASTLPTSARPLAILLLGGLFLGACATKPPTRTEFLGNGATLQRVDDTVRAQIDRRRAAEVAGGVTRVALRPTILAAGVERPASLADADIAPVLREMDRQLCYALSDRFEVAPAATGAGGDVATVEVQVTRIQATNAAASVASAVVSRAIPGPGSLRLPVGRGGLAVEARALVGDGREAAAMAWSRGAGVAFDRGSLSAVGDAHRFASAFADDFAEWLAGPDRPARARAEPDPCARFGPRIDVAQQAARFGLGLHTLGASGATPKTDATVPAAAPAPQSEASMPTNAAPSSR
jgi:hypothetical protein